MGCPLTPNCFYKKIREERSATHQRHLSRSRAAILCYADASILYRFMPTSSLNLCRRHRSIYADVIAQFNRPRRVGLGVCNGASWVHPCVRHWVCDGVQQLCSDEFEFDDGTALSHRHVVNPRILMPPPFQRASKVPTISDPLKSVQTASH